jgi:transposase-like protein
MDEEGREGSYYQGGIDFLIIAELTFFLGCQFKYLFLPNLIYYIMKTFKGQGVVDFFDTFKSDEHCLKYLADHKWNPKNGGFKCTKCNHNKCTIRKKNLARDCNKCHHIESPTAGTMFHKVKLGLRNAFYIAFEMSTNSRGVSATQMAKKVGVSRQAAWCFMHKVRESMKSRETNKMVNEVQVLAFAYGWKENFRPTKSRSPKRKKVVAAIELNERGGVVRAYFKSVENYSSKELIKIFKSHISVDAAVICDNWSGFIPIKSSYKITQKNDAFQNFIQTNHIVHHLKTWFRSAYTWMHKCHFQRYLDEFSYRINSSTHKDVIFDSLIRRMISTKPLIYKEIKISN